MFIFTICIGDYKAIDIKISKGKPILLRLQIFVRDLLKSFTHKSGSSVKELTKFKCLK